MDRVNRSSTAAALVAISIGMVSVSCGDTLGQLAHVRVVMGGMTTQANAVDIVLAPAIYDFVAAGVADADSADITLTVFNRQAVEITTIQFSLTLEEANASPGDIGTGESTGVRVIEGTQSVTIDFFWQGSTPAADVDVDVNFYDSPDILDWGTDPREPVEPTTSVYVWAEATNNEGSQEELTVSSQFIEAGSGLVLNFIELDWVGDSSFEGTIDAPEEPGAHSLRVVATDLTGGTTQHERIYRVQ